MKSRVFSVALLSAMAAMASSQASATNVELYGVVDYGMSIQNRSYADDSSATVTAMKTGQYLGPRFGLKGTEDLGNGVKLGFVLESGFDGDTGMMGQGGRLFGRDARLYLEGDFGYLSFGRMGPVVGGNGPYALFGRLMNPFSCGWADVGGTLQLMALGYPYVDNAVAYRSPKFGGVDATLQYSFGTDVSRYGSGNEGTSSVERMYSGALRYQNDRVLIAAGIERINQAQPAAREAGLDDSISYNLGGNFDAGWAKLYAYGQYSKNYSAAAKTTIFAVPSGVDGYGVILGAEKRALGGNFLTFIGYGSYKGSHDRDMTMKTYQVALGYHYSLSKRTTLYTAADWIRSDYSDAYKNTHPKAMKGVYEFIFGISHKF